MNHPLFERDSSDKLLENGRQDQTRYPENGFQQFFPALPDVLDLFVMGHLPLLVMALGEFCESLSCLDPQIVSRY
jgi:hypothetical protein